MKQINVYLLALLFLVFASCNDDDDDDRGAENEEEEITTLVMEFNPILGGESLSFSFSPDGEQETILLDANTTYTAELMFLNTEETPVEDVTLEILEENDEHLVCFETTTGIDFSYNDFDQNGLEVGLSNTVMSGMPSTGTLNVMLRHQPDLKETFDAINCTVGGVEINATFDVIVE